MRGLWVDSGNDPDWAKVYRHSISALYFDLFDPRVTAPYLLSMVDRSVQVGVYVASNWPQVSGNGRDFAEKTSARLKEVMTGGVTKPSFPKVQLDMEEHDPGKIADALKRWRELHRYQDTSWTMEAMQGGWMDPAFVQTVLDCRVRVVPQYYTGDMRPMAQDVAFRDLLVRGFPPQVISGFYDAAALPINWDGWAFTMGRLP